MRNLGIASPRSLCEKRGGEKALPTTAPLSVELFPRAESLENSLTRASERLGRVFWIQGGRLDIFTASQFDGLDPFELSAQSSLMPASTLKVLTSTVALERLGPDFRFETQVTWSVDPANPTVANDLTIYGSGDPTWGMAELGETPSTRMAELARVLTSSGIQEVSGPIQWKVSDERWNQLSTPPGWKANDLVSCYGALPTAFNLGLNCELFVVTGPNSGYWRDPRIQDPVEIKISKGTTDLVGLVRTESGFKVVGTLRSGTTAALPIPRDSSLGMA